MKRETKMQAIELLADMVVTVEMAPSVNGIVSPEYLGITKACHNAINVLIENGYSVSMSDGHILVNSYSLGK